MYTSLSLLHMAPCDDVEFGQLTGLVKGSGPVSGLVRNDSLTCGQ